MSLLERHDERDEVLRFRTTVRGREIQLVWRDGFLSGDPEVVRRVTEFATLRSLNLRDARDVVRSLELALGTRPVIDLGG